MPSLPAPETDWYVATTTRLMVARSCSGLRATTSWALGSDLGRPFLRDLAPGGHEAQVDIGEIVGVEGLRLQDLVAVGDFRPLAAAGGQCHDFIGREGPLGEDAEHLAAHIAGRTDDGDLETH